MILEYNDDTNEISAAITTGDSLKKITYCFSVSICASPVCRCNTVDLKLIACDGDFALGPLPANITLCIDFEMKELSGTADLPADQVESARHFLSFLDDDDYQLLHQTYFNIKTAITKKASPDEFDMDFDFYEVEKNGLMYAYNDVLPYGEYLEVTVNDRKYLLYDQYCLLPKCTCTDTFITVFSAEEDINPEKELAVFSLTYQKRKWGVEWPGDDNLSLSDFTSSIDAQLPDFYEKLLQRHKRMKAIYNECRAKNFSTQLPVVKSKKIGRNDPCPCGSGKKYKKCCINK